MCSSDLTDFSGAEASASDALGRVWSSDTGFKDCSRVSIMIICFIYMPYREHLASNLIKIFMNLSKIGKNLPPSA